MSLHFRAVVVGVTLVGTICYAIYSHFTQREREREEMEQTYSSGGSRPKVLERRTSMDLPTNCSICLSMVNKGKAAHFLECGHVFHKHCIQTWLLSSNSCPNCRHTF